MRDFCVLTGFENVVSKIKLDQSSQAYTDTKHRTRYSKQFHNTSTHTFFWLVLAVGVSMKFGNSQDCSKALLDHLLTETMGPNI